METRILAPTEEAVALAARILREGGLVGLPTETVYGLGANALDEAAVRAIFAAKGRPADNPLIVHVPTPEDAAPLCHISDASRALMERFCPGPLTLLMPKKPCVPEVVNAGLPSVAVRIPSHPWPRPAPTPPASPAPPRPCTSTMTSRASCPSFWTGASARWGWRAPWWT